LGSAYHSTAVNWHQAFRHQARRSWKRLPPYRLAPRGIPAYKRRTWCLSS